MSGYLQRLLERAAPAMPGAPEAAPATRTASPVAAQDQRLHDPGLAAALPPVPGTADDVLEPGSDASDSFWWSAHAMPEARRPPADPVREPAAERDAAARREPAHTIERHVVSLTEPAWRITERTVVQPQEAAPRGSEAPPGHHVAGPQRQDGTPPSDSAPTPMMLSPAPDARPQPRAQTPARRATEPSVRSEVLLPRAPAPPVAAPPDMPVPLPPRDPEPHVVARGAEGPISAARAPTIDIEPPPLPPPALPSPVGGPPSVEEPPRPTSQRPPSIERVIEPVRQEPPARPQVTAQSASAIGPLARRRRTATLFGMRRR